MKRKKRAKLKLLAVIMTVILLVALIIYFVNAKNAGSSQVAESGIMLNEVMASNKGSVSDNYGDYPDWIELYNESDEDVDIGGYGLSDEIGVPKFVFKSGTTIPAHGYVVVYCSGEAKDDFHAPFKITATDDVVLYDSSSHLLDSLTLRAVTAGHTLARSPENTDEWTEMSPTPNYPNTAEGVLQYEQYLLEGEDIGVYINEFMASNATTVKDKYGVYSDWIEIYNSTNDVVDLSGFGISDNLSQPLKYKLPDGVKIQPKGYLVVFCSGNETKTGDDEIHAPFSLRAYEEAVVLTSSRGKIVDSFSYTRQEDDISMARIKDGTGDFNTCSTPTPGYANSDDGYREFMKSLNMAVGNLYISEISSLNSSTYAASDGVYYDWVEIHNKGSEAVSLSGYALTDNPNNPAKWLFPDISISPDEYIVVFASGNDSKTKKNNLHTNFGISGEGETVFLYDENAVLKDKLASNSQKGNTSCGRDNEGAPVVYSSPTPGKVNGEGKTGVTSMPEFVTLPGIYDGEISVEIKAQQGETIFYTTDNTTPTSSSQQYTGPITISKNTVIRAVAVRDGYISGHSNSGTYLFKSDNVNHQLPVVTLVTDPKNLWDDKIGIYAYGSNYISGEPFPFSSANFSQRGENWERPACFSVFDDSGKEVFSQNVKIRIAGSFGRGRAQKGFNIIADSQYGNNRMEYPFFDNREYTEYKALVLRCGGQDQYASKICDELSTGLLEGSDVAFLYQAYKPYVLYLNGQYWGVYFMKEKRNRFFVAQHEGIADTDNMDIMKASTKVTYGSNDEWLKLMDYVNSHDLSNASAYSYIESQVDLQSFIDYMICEIYVRNSDYANIQYYKVDGGKWKWIYYDFCWSWASDVTHNTLNKRLTSTQNCSPLLVALLKNSTFKDRFVRRFAELMKTVYEPNRVIALADELASYLAPEIERERAIFNTATFRGMPNDANVASYSGWLRNVEKIRNFAKERPAIVKKHLQQELNLSDSYMKEVFS
ncbi:MAG: lamin tail domain-containing protein [Clostridia bacterium]|nr:lamin tail domain-containing protein [Clostridia bacterium]